MDFDTSSRRFMVAGLYGLESLKKVCESHGLKFNDYIRKQSNQTSAGLQIGDLVWAKMRGYPPWPAQIINPEATLIATKNKKSHQFVNFFASGDYAWVPVKNITPHSESVLKKFSKNKKSKILQQAIDEIKKVSEKRRIDKNNKISANSLSGSSNFNALCNSSGSEVAERNETLEYVSGSSSSSDSDGFLEESLAINEREQSSQVSMSSSSSQTSTSIEDLPGSSISGPEEVSNIESLSFHPFHGSNVVLTKDRSVLCVKIGTYTNAFAFTSRPLQVGETITMFVQGTLPNREKGLLFGITSFDPATICSDDTRKLPEIFYTMLDRLGYWELKHLRYSFRAGDKITFKINKGVQIEGAVNGDLNSVLCVPAAHSKSLWLFVNLTDCVSKLYMPDPTKSNEGVDSASEAVKEEAKGADVPGSSGLHLSGECVICFEEQANCVLYKCGHMCLCYECAYQLWIRGGSRAHCPICRDPILDVVKIYK